MIASDRRMGRRLRPQGQEPSGACRALASLFDSGPAGRALPNTGRGPLRPRPPRRGRVRPGLLRGPGRPRLRRGAVRPLAMELTVDIATAQ